MKIALIAAALLGAGLSGACMAESEAEAQLRAFLDSRTVASHCRTTSTWTGVSPKWKVVAGLIDGLKSDPLHYFDIRADWQHNPPRPGKIGIRFDDQFRLGVTDSKLELRHSRAGKRVGTGTLEFNGIWAEGPALLPDRTEVGTYVVFRLQDNPFCEHDNQKRSPCRTLHFEYFDKQDSLSEPDRPDLGNNVKPLSPQVTCEGAVAETEEGDGDQGPD